VTTHRDNAAHVAPTVGEGVFGLDATVAEARIILISAPWETTTSYGRGTAKGPAAIRAASVQVDLFDVELGEPYLEGIAMLGPSAELERRAASARRDALEVIAAFDSDEPVPRGALERVNDASRWLDAHLEGLVGEHAERALVGVIGGDHSVAYASIAAQAERVPGLGVLQFDAHADLRVAYQGFVGSHASVFHRVARLEKVSKVVNVGVRDLCRQEHDAIKGSDGRIVAFLDADMARSRSAGAPFLATAKQVAEALPRDVYVSFDIDGLDPSLCPHTGTPVPGGLSWHQAMAVLGAVVSSGRRIVGFDLCEVAPGPAGDEWDANVAARLLYKLIGYALASRAT
jgi:agmatinase